MTDHAARIRYALKSGPLSEHDIARYTGLTVDVVKSRLLRNGPGNMTEAFRWFARVGDGWGLTWRGREGLS